MDDRTSRRLLTALAVSAALHASLLYTVRLAPRTAAPATAGALHARLQLEASAEPGSGAARAVDPRAAPRAVSVPSRPGAQRRAVVPPSPAPAALQPAAFDEPARASPEPLPAIELPGVRDLTWYPARQLDVFPQPLVAYKPVYPEQAGAEGVRGEVTLLLLIDESGAVHEASVVEAQPEGYFEKAALAAFDGARFEPARKDGRAVRSRILVKMAFSPESKD